MYMFALKQLNNISAQIINFDFLSVRNPLNCINFVNFTHNWSSLQDGQISYRVKRFTTHIL